MVWSERKLVKEIKKENLIPVHWNLKELESIGVLESQKVGRETLYVNKELIEILKK